MLHVLEMALCHRMSIAIHSYRMEGYESVMLYRDTALEVNHGCEAVQVLLSEPPGATQYLPRSDGTAKWIFRGLVKEGGISRDFLRRTMPKAPPKHDDTLTIAACKEYAAKMIKAYKEDARSAQACGSLQPCPWRVRLRPPCCQQCKGMQQHGAVQIMQLHIVVTRMQQPHGVLDDVIDVASYNLWLSQCTVAACT